MLKVNWKNIIGIIVLSTIVLFMAVHFEQLCDMITKIFKL